MPPLFSPSFAANCPLLVKAELPPFPPPPRSPPRLTPPHPTHSRALHPPQNDQTPFSCLDTDRWLCNILSTVASWVCLGSLPLGATPGQDLDIGSQARWQGGGAGAGSGFSQHRMLVKQPHLSITTCLNLTFTPPLPPPSSNPSHQLLSASCSGQQLHLLPSATTKPSLTLASDPLGTGSHGSLPSPGSNPSHLKSTSVRGFAQRMSKAWPCLKGVSTGPWLSSACTKPSPRSPESFGNRGGFPLRHGLSWRKVIWAVLFYLHRRDEVVAHQ